MPTTILCITSYFKGQDFLRECRALGCRVLLLTAENLKDAEWPIESMDERYLMPEELGREQMLDALSYLARSEAIDRIVALDEFDQEIAAAAREHLRIPGMGETTMRYFRDKLAMRMRAKEHGVLVPEFVSLINRAEVALFLDAVAPPWILKPRSSASAIGLKKMDDVDEVWRVLDQLENRRPHHLLEQFIPGQVMHVDSIAWDMQPVFAESSGYLNTPFDVYHGGGLFATATLPRGSQLGRDLTHLNAEIIRGLGLVRGVLHTEFIRAAEDGRLYFLETAARVGGAYIVDMIDAATDVNLNTRRLRSARITPDSFSRSRVRNGRTCRRMMTRTSSAASSRSSTRDSSLPRTTGSVSTRSWSRTWSASMRTSTRSCRPPRRRWTDGAFGNQ